MATDYYKMLYRITGTRTRAAALRMLLDSTVTDDSSRTFLRPGKMYRKTTPGVMRRKKKPKKNPLGAGNVAKRKKVGPLRQKKASTLGSGYRSSS